MWGSQDGSAGDVWKAQTLFYAACEDYFFYNKRSRSDYYIDDFWHIMIQVTSRINAGYISAYFDWDVKQ